MTKYCATVSAIGSCAGAGRCCAAAGIAIAMLTTIRRMTRMLSPLRCDSSRSPGWPGPCRRLPRRAPWPAPLQWSRGRARSTCPAGRPRPCRSRASAARRRWSCPADRTPMASMSRIRALACQWTVSTELVVPTTDTPLNLDGNWLKDAVEDDVDVLQLFVEIEGAADLGRGQHARDVRIDEQQRLEVAAFGERPHRVALHPFVGLLARDAFLRELEQHRAGKDDAARAVEVLAHTFRVDDHAARDPGEPAQHVVERDEAVRQDHALHRRMRDVALVPQRDVLERRVGVAAQQPRQPADLLAADRVALVRHRRRALLSLRERLLDLADLGLLQAADFQGELLQRRPRDRQSRQQ